jgi:hypothetical protein
MASDYLFEQVTARASAVHCLLESKTANLDECVPRILETRADVEAALEEAQLDREDWEEGIRWASALRAILTVQIEQLESFVQRNLATPTDVEARLAEAREELVQLEQEYGDALIPMRMQVFVGNPEVYGKRASAVS